MRRKVAKPGRAVIRTEFDGSARVATFRVGEPVPAAEYVRIVVPAGCDEDEAWRAEMQARAKARGVKVVREPKPLTAVPKDASRRERSSAVTLRQAVVARAAVTEGVRDRDALAAALDEVLTEAGL